MQASRSRLAVSDLLYIAFGIIAKSYLTVPYAPPGIISNSKKARRFQGVFFAILIKMFLLKDLNLLLRFILELCLASAALYIGFHLGATDFLRWVFGLGLVVGVITIWSIYMAPRSERQLPRPQRIVVEIALFAGAVIGLLYTGQTTNAWALAISVAVNEVLLLMLEK